MRNYLSIHKNWRINAICLLAAIAMLLLLSEADSIAVLITTKVAGLIITFAAITLAGHWHREGKMKEIDDIIGED